MNHRLNALTVFALSSLIIHSPALAQTGAAQPGVAQSGDTRPARRIMLGGGIQTVATYPGASGNKAAFLPFVDTWREGGQFPVESPDEANGFAVLGQRGGTAFGPAISFADQRAADAVPGLAAVGFGVEAGAFAETWLAPPLRLRAELRHGIGAHRALTGDIAADFAWRQGPGESAVATFGPRLRWGSAKFNRAYFAVPAAAPGTAPVGTFAPYDPGSGIYAAGVNAGLRLPLGSTFGLYGYAGYDRLIGTAADSPVVRAGSRDQYSAGLALTYRFTI